MTRDRAFLGVAGHCGRAVLVTTRPDGTLRGVAIRECPELPATVAERLYDYRAPNNADSLLYRTELAAAAVPTRWPVLGYDRKTVFGRASEVLGRDAEALFREIGDSIGPPRQQDHRTAMAAALVAGARLAQRRGKLAHAGLDRGRRLEECGARRCPGPPLFRRDATASNVTLT